MEEMKKFTEKHDESCSKCGYCAMTWKFVEGGVTSMEFVGRKLVPVKQDDDSLFEVEDLDHILKTCTRCGYFWKEHTKDAKV